MITFNHAEFIAEAIEGVLMQEIDFEIELVIADDASTDRTGEIIKSYIEMHPRGSWIKYTRHFVNKGMRRNFFWALEQCKGEYIALCEGDDYWIDNKKLQMQYEFLELNSNYSFCFHDSFFYKDGIKVKLFSEKYSILKSKNSFSIDDLFENQWFIPTASIFFRRINIPNWIKHVNAGDFSLQLLLSYDNKFFYLSNVMSIYRIHPFGISHKNRNYRKRLNDIVQWIVFIPKARNYRVLRWFFANLWRLIFAKLGFMKIK